MAILKDTIINGELTVNNRNVLNEIDEVQSNVIACSNELASFLDGDSEVNANKILWSGAHYMSGSQTINFSEKISSLSPTTSTTSSPSAFSNAICTLSVKRDFELSFIIILSTTISIVCF